LFWLFIFQAPKDTKAPKRATLKLVSGAVPFTSLLMMKPSKKQPEKRKRLFGNFMIAVILS